MADAPRPTDKDRQVTELWNILQSAKPTIQGVWYNGKSFKIDGYRFVECRFDKCTLHLDSTEFELERCHISDDTTLVYGASSIRPIRMFLARLDMFDAVYPGFGPTRHPDGTITIK